MLSARDSVWETTRGIRCVSVLVALARDVLYPAGPVTAGSFADVCSLLSSSVIMCNNFAILFNCVLIFVYIYAFINGSNVHYF